MLCSIRDNDERVINLKIYEDTLIFISLNLYPYNPGHLMIIPNRHIIKLSDLTKEESNHIIRAIQGLQILLDDTYNPKGYNVGINQGKIAGGSVEHLHFHLVPRYGAELGYIDIVGKTRVVPEGLNSVEEKLKSKIKKYLNQDFFDEFK
ncbi:MAG: HIT family protein [Candidatus Thorarchaeota archaeon]